MCWELAELLCSESCDQWHGAPLEASCYRCPLAIPKLTLFKAFINDLGHGAEGTISKLAEDRSCLYSRGLGCHPERPQQTGEKNGLTGTSLIQQGEMWSLLPGGKITAGTSTGWRSSGWKAPCQKKPWGSWWIPSQSWASNVPLWPQKLKASGTASGSVLLGGGGRWSFLSALLSVSSADLPRIRDTWTYWRGPSKRPGGQ